VAKAKSDQVAVGTPNDPSYVHHVDAAKYETMKRVLLPLLPKGPPGVTQKEMFLRLDQKAPREVFPGNTYQWWGKCVQLDLEAKGVLVRDAKAKPLRWWKA